MAIKEGKLLYHLTTLDVFESIVARGLLSRAELKRQQLNFTDTANHDILDKRERLGLSEYIPFHFHPYSDYDLAVKLSNKDRQFLYLCLRRTYAQENAFRILPIHPTSNARPNLFTYEEGFDQIDWDVMELTKEEAQKKGLKEKHHLVRMAECLSPEMIPITAFLSIAVKDEETQTAVSDILAKYPLGADSPYVNIHEYYF